MQVDEVEVRPLDDLVGSRLEEAGLVERRRCPTDRRVWELVLDPAGRDTASSGFPRPRRHPASCRNLIADQETEAILGALAWIDQAVL